MWGAELPADDDGQPASVEIIIPARNEAQRLPAGLTALTEAAAALPCGAAITVVDNASTDATASIARDWPGERVPVRLLPCSRRGKGAAVRAGLLASRAPFVGYLDADMATGLSALATAMGLLASGSQVVIGSRAHAGSVVQHRHSRVRALGAAVFRGSTRVIVPGVSDTQCGFKFFSGPLVRAAAGGMTTSGFSFDVELLARCRRLGGEVTEIPVLWRDMPGSTFSVKRHSVSAFTQLAAIWMSLHAAGDHGPRPIPIPPALEVDLPAGIASAGLAPTGITPTGITPAGITDVPPAAPEGQAPALASPAPGEAPAP